jgi:hypothetical protein
MWIAPTKAIPFPAAAFAFLADRFWLWRLAAELPINVIEAHWFVLSHRRCGLIIKHASL